MFLYRGRLFKCVYCLLANDFNRAFDTNLELIGGDYLELISTSKDEIYDFLISRKPFCGYCKPITELVPWGLSERKLDEWT